MANQGRPKPQVLRTLLNKTGFPLTKKKKKKRKKEKQYEAETVLD